jgi:hypothetical protein
MVDLFFRPMAGFHKKYEAMCKIHSSRYANSYIPVVTITACLMSLFSSRRTIYFPVKFSCFATVFKNGVNKFESYHREKTSGLIAGCI